MKNFSIIIASYLGGKFEGDIERLDVLTVTVKNLRFYFPEAEIIVMFDKVGVEKVEGADICITHQNGLGYSWNKGMELAKNEYILQTEDDWIIQKRNRPGTLNEDTLFIQDYIDKCFDFIDQNKNSCIRLDKGVFTNLPKNPLTYEKIDDNIYKYNIPSEDLVKKNPWSMYYFCNHPQIKHKDINKIINYKENCSPYEVEINICHSWRKLKLDVFYISMIDKGDELFTHIGGTTSYHVKFKDVNINNYILYLKKKYI